MIDAAPTYPRDRRAANLRAWQEVLDRLERDVQATEQLAVAAASSPVPIAPEPAPWQPPQLDGPLPDQLLGRAREIHLRQTRAKAALSAALEKSRAEQQATRSARRAPAATPAPAYIDVSA